MQFSQQTCNLQRCEPRTIQPIRASHKQGMGRLWIVLGALMLGQLAYTNALYAAETPAKKSQSQMVQLNSATASELAQGLVGVGQRRAQAIVDYRQKVGDFRNDDELSQVKGIGSHVLDANKARISYAPSKRKAAAKKVSGKTQK